MKKLQIQAQRISFTEISEAVSGRIDKHNSTQRKSKEIYQTVYSRRLRNSAIFLLNIVSSVILAEITLWA